MTDEVGTLRVMRIHKTKMLPSLKKHQANKGTEVWVHASQGEHYVVRPGVITERFRHGARLRLVLDGDEISTRYNQLALRHGTEYEPVEPDPPKSRRRIVHPKPPAPVLKPKPTLTHRPLENIKPPSNGKEIPSMTHDASLSIRSVPLNETGLVVGKAASKSSAQKGVDRYAYVVVADADGELMLRTVARRRKEIWEACEKRKRVKPSGVHILLCVQSLEKDGDLLDEDLREIAERGYLELKVELEKEHQRQRAEQTRDTVIKTVTSMSDEQLAKLARLLGE